MLNIEVPEAPVYQNSLKCFQKQDFSVSEIIYSIILLFILFSTHSFSYSDLFVCFLSFIFLLSPFSPDKIYDLCPEGDQMPISL